ncbi:MAG: efflux RND transporter permease subunit, partial [Myxococcales bacterium]|nr:efflux RND transporter permease subunit [Myxococcales bacterium]
ARGVEVLEALVEAGATRFRPVVLTALTTVLGLVPMAVGVSFDFRKLRWIVGSESASWWGPMAIAVIFGLGVSTLLTLVMVPTLYGVLEDIRELPGRIRRALGRGAAPESGPSPESAE